MKKMHGISTTIQHHYPATQAVYLFGSHGSAHEWPDSDIDIALLLPHADAKQTGGLGMSDLRFALESELKKTVDLINLRRVSTVLQKEVVTTGQRIYTGDAYAAEEFEMLTLSFYQKLNEERREILAEFHKTGRAYAVYPERSRRAVPERSRRV